MRPAHSLALLLLCLAVGLAPEDSAPAASHLLPVGCALGAATLINRFPL